jgi:hypothetical protein
MVESVVNIPPPHDTVVVMVPDSIVVEDVTEERKAYLASYHPPVVYDPCGNQIQYPGDESKIVATIVPYGTDLSARPPIRSRPAPVFVPLEGVSIWSRENMSHGAAFIESTIIPMMQITSYQEMRGRYG